MLVVSVNVLLTHLLVFCVTVSRRSAGFVNSHQFLPLQLVFMLATKCVFSCCNNVSHGKNALQSAGSVNNVIPHFINNAMPRWFAFIFLFALISAAMSTLSSQFHTMGTAIGRDVYEQIWSKNAKNSMLITRIGVVVMIISSVSLSYLFDGQSAIIARSTAIFFALCACIFLPTYL